MACYQIFKYRILNNIFSLPLIVYATTSFKLFFQKTDILHKKFAVYKGNPQLSIVEWIFSICVSHISLLDYLVPDPIFKDANIKKTERGRFT